MTTRSLLLVASVALGVLSFAWVLSRAPASGGSSAFERKQGGLTTDMTIHSVPLADVLDGGPGKDGIPALTHPAFTTVAGASPLITDSINGILVTAGDDVRFYPYNILVWHEIVNDRVGGVDLVVTFCPLCGSAIVYEARVEGKHELFGVSGKLYDSNLLMYDKATESLWSQIGGEAVVGTRTGQKLTLFPSQVVPFKTIREQYPHAKVLSADTGHSRDYSLYPYGDYDENEHLLFPVSVDDTRLPAKEIMYVVDFNGHSVAFRITDLTEGAVARVEVSGQTLTAVRAHRAIQTSPVLPGYHAMWFAWAAHHQADGVVWAGGKQL